MSYDIKSLYEGKAHSNVQQLYRELVERLRAFLREVDQLQQENERLAQENEELRDLLTQVQRPSEEHAAQFFGFKPQGKRPLVLHSSVPPEAADFYAYLPRVFSFADYFRIADTYGIDIDTAKNYLLAFVRTELVAQHGSHMQKQGL